MEGLRESFLRLRALDRLHDTRARRRGKRHGQHGAERSARRVIVKLLWQRLLGLQYAVERRTWLLARRSGDLLAELVERFLDKRLELPDNDDWLEAIRHRKRLLEDRRSIQTRRGRAAQRG